VNAPVGTNLYVYCTEYVKIRPSVGTKPCPLRQSSMRLPQGTRKLVPTEATYVRKQRTGKFQNTGNRFYREHSYQRLQMKNPTSLMMDLRGFGMTARELQGSAERP